MRTTEQVCAGKSRLMPPTTRPGGDGGAAAVEFALVMPILLALVFGIINFGFIFAAQISLNNSARDASRAGVVKPLSSTGTAITCSQIATLARNGATTLGLDKTKITITVTGPAGTCTSPAGGADTGATTSAMCTQSAPPPYAVTQLNVSLTYTAVSPAPLVPPSSATLSAQGVFQCEYV